MNLKLSGITVTLPPENSVLFRLPSLEIASGSRVLIQGPSGKGKTTLLHLIAGLFAPTEGSVQVGDQNLRYLSDSELCRMRRRHFGIVFQKLNLLEHLTASENVLLAAPPRGTDAREVAKALDAVGLSNRADERAGNLSLGEQQRVAVARILVQKPDIVLADEPTSSLDEKNAFLVIRNLIGLDGKRTLVVVSHDHRIEREFTEKLDFERLVTT